MQILFKTNLELSKPKHLINNNDTVWLIHGMYELLDDFLNFANINKNMGLFINKIVRVFGIDTHFFIHKEHLIKYFPELRLDIIKKLEIELSISGGNLDNHKFLTDIDWFLDEHQKLLTDNIDYIENLIDLDYLIYKSNQIYKDYIEFIKEKNLIEYNNFQYNKNVLEPEIKWFNSFSSKYSIVIGKYTNKNDYNTRGLIEDFVAAGMCYYQKYIFINSYRANYQIYKNSHFKHWNQLLILHEIGHALHFDRQLNILKNYSHPSIYKNEFTEIVKKCRQKSRYLYTNYKKKAFIKYFLEPEIINKRLVKWSRAHEECFAEAFAYAFQFILNGISPLLISKQKNSEDWEHNFIAILKPAILWLLENIDWTILLPEEKQIDKKIRKTKDFFNEFEIINKSHFKGNKQSHCSRGGFKKIKIKY